MSFSWLVAKYPMRLKDHTNVKYSMVALLAAYRSIEHKIRSNSVNLAARANSGGCAMCRPMRS